MRQFHACKCVFCEIIFFKFNQILTLFNLLQVFISIHLYELFNKCGLDLSLGSLNVVAWVAVFY